MALMAFTDSALIAAEVHAEIKRQRRTQREVAAVLGIPQGPFWQRLHGNTPFRADELAKLSEYLEVPVSQFYGDLVSAEASGPPDNRPPSKPPAGPGPGHPGGPPPPSPTSPTPANPPAKTTGRAA